MIAFYYGLTGVACVIYWRHELLRSAKNFVFIGVAPLIGGGMLFYLLYESIGDLSDPKESYSGSEVFGVGVPLAIAIMFTGLGFVIMVAWRLFGPPAGREFFNRQPFEAVPHEVAVGEGKVEAIGVSEAEADAGLASERKPPIGRGADMGTIVVGYDGSDCAHAALDHALRLAADLGDRRRDRLRLRPGRAGRGVQGPPRGRAQIGEKVTAEAAERAHDAGVEVEVVLREDRPSTRCWRSPPSATRA